MRASLVRDLARGGDDPWRPKGEEHRRQIEAQIVELDRTIADLEEEVAARRTWNLENDGIQWWHDELTALVEGLELFFHPDQGLYADVQERLAFADEIEARSVSGDDVARRWRSAIASIADREACPAYGGLTIEPQIGLVPLRRDPDSGLWEFVHLQTGQEPRIDPATGRWRVTEATGLVFVLLPAGEFAMAPRRARSMGRTTTRWRRRTTVPCTRWTSVPSSCRSTR